MHKYLFLDIDGVLNSESWYKSNKPTILNIEDEKQKFISESLNMLIIIVIILAIITIIAGINLINITFLPVTFI